MSVTQITDHTDPSEHVVQITVQIDSDGGRHVIHANSMGEAIETARVIIQTGLQWNEEDGAAILVIPPNRIHWIRIVPVERPPTDVRTPTLTNVADTVGPAR